jgi:hypothetical protein
MAENELLAERIRRLAPALTEMVHDLAEARRQNAALRRENLRLRDLLDARPRAGRHSGHPRHETAGV